MSECECWVGWWPLRSGQRLRQWRSKKRNNVRRFRLRLGGGGAGRERKVIRPGPELDRVGLVGGLGYEPLRVAWDAERDTRAERYVSAAAAAAAAASTSSP